MSFKNAVIKAEVIFDGHSIVADVRCDWIGGEIYIDEVMYNDADIKSILSDESNEDLEENLQAYCIMKRL